MAGTGVFLCTCGKELRRRLDFKRMAKEIKGETVKLVEIVDYLCQRDIDYIAQHLRWEDERKLEKVVIGACSPKMKGEVFKAVLQNYGLEEDSLVIADIREGCAWVHEDRKSATEKATELIREAVEFEPPATFLVKAEPPVLLYGGFDALRAAHELSSLGIENMVVNNAPFERDCDACSRHSTCSPKKRPCIYEKISPIHFPYEVMKVQGKLGEFEVVLEREKYVNPKKCINCGRCVEACPEGAISYVDGVFPVYYLNSELCNCCEGCVKVCPTDAIDLGSDIKTVKAGQMIYFHQGNWEREGIYNCWDEDPAAGVHKGNDAVLRAVTYVNGVKKYNRPSYLKETCANLRIISKELEARGCDYCSSACPYGVISYDRELIIDAKACMECGLCQSSCPMGCLPMKVHNDEEIYSKIEASMRAEISPKILMFACNGCGRATVEAAGSRRLDYPAVMPLYLPCLGYVSESHILRAFELGAQGVFMLGCRAGKCSYGGGFRKAGENLRVIRGILYAFGLEKERVMLIEGNHEKPEHFTRSLKNFASKLDGSPLAGKGAKPVNLEKTKREVLLGQLIGFKKKLKEPRETVIRGGGIPYGKVNVDEEKCVNCGACASHCNTGALTTGETKGYAEILNFTYPYCIACNICREICPEKAIEIERVLDIAAFIKKEKVSFEADLLRCAKCGKPFMSKRMYEKIKAAGRETTDALSYCYECREDSLINELFGD